MIRNQYTGEVVPTLRSVREALNFLAQDITEHNENYPLYSTKFLEKYEVNVLFDHEERWDRSDFHIAEGDLNAEWNGTEVHAIVRVYSPSKDHAEWFDLYLYDSGEAVCIQFVVRPEYYNNICHVIYAIRSLLGLRNNYPNISMNELRSEGCLVMELEEGLYTSERNVRALDSWAVERHAQDPDPIWREDLSELVSEFETKQNNI